MNFFPLIWKSIYFSSKPQMQVTWLMICLIGVATAQTTDAPTTFEPTTTTSTTTSTTTTSTPRTTTEGYLILNVFNKHRIVFWEYSFFINLDQILTFKFLVDSTPRMFWGGSVHQQSSPGQPHRSQSYRVSGVLSGKPRLPMVLLPTQVQVLWTGKKIGQKFCQLFSFCQTLQHI